MDSCLFMLDAIQGALDRSSQASVPGYRDCTRAGHDLLCTAHRHDQTQDSRARDRVCCRGCFGCWWLRRSVFTRKFMCYIVYRACRSAMPNSDMKTACGHVASPTILEGTGAKSGSRRSLHALLHRQANTSAFIHAHEHCFRSLNLFTGFC